MRFNREPFERPRNYRQYKPLIKKAENKLQERLTTPEKLMYNYETGGVFFVDTGKLFTGKFAIPADKFERIIKVINGQEVCNLVREKSGKNFYFELVGNRFKQFKTTLSESEQQAEISKLLEADQKTYDEMIDRFSKSINI